MRPAGLHSAMAVPGEAAACAPRPWSRCTAGRSSSGQASRGVGATATIPEDLFVGPAELKDAIRGAPEPEPDGE
jgi:hypothetical protein